MKRKIFLDANVIIDWLDKSSDRHSAAEDVLEKVRKQSRPWISPTTLAIVWYVLGKNFRDKKTLINKMEKFISHFNFTTEDHAIVNQIIGSGFDDLEDALQYFSAVNSKIDIIITWDINDFLKSKIPVLHPLHFLQIV